MKNPFFKRIAGGISFLLVILVVFIFVFAVSNLGEDKNAEDRMRLSEALHKAAVACYAIEGAYPSSADHLIENYGIQFDSSRFVIKYEFYGSNLLPDITVLYKK